MFVSISDLICRRATWLTLHSPCGLQRDIQKHGVRLPIGDILSAVLLLGALSIFRFAWQKAVAMPTLLYLLMCYNGIFYCAVIAIVHWINSFFLPASWALTLSFFQLSLRMRPDLLCAPI